MIELYLKDKQDICIKIIKEQPNLTLSSSDFKQKTDEMHQLNQYESLQLNLKPEKRVAWHYLNPKCDMIKEVNGLITLRLYVANGEKKCNNSLR